MAFEQFLETYGYPALFAGSFFEGETPLLLAAFLAHQGYFSIWAVVVVAGVATMLSDQIFFHLGRTRGRTFIDKRPRWQAKAARTQNLLEHHGTAVALGFRFLYGMRTVTPFVLGMSGFGRMRFLILNFVSALLWAAAFSALGWTFGEFASRIFGSVERYEKEILAGIVAVSAAIWALFLHRRRRETRLSTP